MAATVILRIEALAYGGEGLGTLPTGKRIFVPRTAPGDLVEVEVVQEKAQHARGRLVALRQAGSSRVAPRCSLADRCGGCQLQQVAPSAQLAAKEEAFYSSLERIGRIPRSTIADAREIVASPTSFAYRGRCRLRAAEGRVGFCEWRSSAVVELTECPILRRPLEELAVALVAALRAAPFADLHDLMLCVDDAGAGAAALVLRTPPDPAARARAQALLTEAPSLRGARLTTSSRTGPAQGHVPARGSVGPMTVGDPTLTVPAPGAPACRLRLRPDLFAQANPAANDLLVALVVDLLDPAPSDTILDLYAGAGNFTFALAARGAQVIAVEESHAALELARTTRDEAGLESQVELRPGDAVASCLDLARDPRTIDLVLMDPPRQGAKAAPAAVAALAPRRVAYVSCDPTTLARDIRAFRELGYLPVTAIPVDLFPHTYHLEGLVLLDACG